MVAACTPGISGLFSITLGTLARRGRTGLSGCRLSELGGIWLIVALLHVPSSLAT